ncbi:MAG: hypothetical protein ACKPAC_11875 [Alphaproteobacteria bacterium]
MRSASTDVEFPVLAIVNPRMAAFNLPTLSTTEACNQHRDMLRRLGSARDALWIAELTDSMAERNRRAIWRAMKAPRETVVVFTPSALRDGNRVRQAPYAVGQNRRLMHHQKAA